MAKEETNKTEGIVTSDAVVKSKGLSDSSKKSMIGKPLLVLGVVALLILAVYVYNTSFRRVTAKSAQQVIEQLDESIPDGEVGTGSGAVLSGYQPKGFSFSVRPATAETIDYKVAPKALEKTYDKARRVLYRQGLNDKKVIAQQTGRTPDFYYDNDFVRCYLSAQRQYENTDYTMRVTCANMKDYEKNTEQIQTFYGLYAKNNPEKAKIVGVGAINVEDSPTKGYKRAELTIIQDTSPEGAVNALFYQTPDGTWNYFKATLLEIYCEEYNTPDVKNAFNGKRCFDKSYTLSTVRP